jgi:threonine dehydratase
VLSTDRVQGYYRKGGYFYDVPNTQGYIGRSEEGLIEGVRYCLEELHLVVEPAGAAGISALFAGKAEIKSGPVYVVVSGSNLDKKYFKEALGL